MSAGEADPTAVDSPDAPHTGGAIVPAPLAAAMDDK
jgi:hypothetical protein